MAAKDHTTFYSLACSTKSILLSRGEWLYLMRLQQMRVHIYGEEGVVVSSVGGRHGHGHIVLGLSWIGQLLVAWTTATPAVVSCSLLMTSCFQGSITFMSTIIARRFNWFQPCNLKAAVIREFRKTLFTNSQMTMCGLDCYLKSTWWRWSSPGRGALLLVSPTNKLFQLVNLHQEIVNFENCLVGLKLMLVMVELGRIHIALLVAIY